MPANVHFGAIGCSAAKHLHVPTNCNGICERTLARNASPVPSVANASCVRIICPNIRKHTRFQQQQPPPLPCETNHRWNCSKARSPVIVVARVAMRSVVIPSRTTRMIRMKLSMCNIDTRIRRTVLSIVKWKKTKMNAFFLHYLSLSLSPLMSRCSMWLCASSPSSSSFARVSV